MDVVLVLQLGGNVCSSAGWGDVCSSCTTAGGGFLRQLEGTAGGGFLRYSWGGMYVVLALQLGGFLLQLEGDSCATAGGGCM